MKKNPNFSFICPNLTRGFTLIELMLVILMLGFIAGMASIKMGDLITKAKVAAVVTNLKTVTTSFRNYYYSHGAYPADTTFHTMPPGMEAYLPAALFDRNTMGGATWNWDGPDYYNYAGLSIDIGTSDWPLERMEQVDHELDDGDLNTGDFRYTWAGDRLTYFIESYPCIAQDHCE